VRARLAVTSGLVGLAALACALVVVLAGDGSAHADQASARAGALCVAAHGRLSSLPELDDLDAIRRAGPLVVAVTLDTARHLLAIDAPDARGGAIRRYAEHLIRQAELTTELQEAATSGDRKRAGRLVEALRDNSRRGQRVGRQIAPGCAGITRSQAPHDSGQAA
jgi:hypothetical protein